MSSTERSRLIRVGDPLPDFELADLEGNQRKKSDLRGLPTVLFFFSSW
jgi:peroxiredoxin